MWNIKYYMLKVTWDIFLGGGFGWIFWDFHSVCSILGVEDDNDNNVDDDDNDNDDNGTYVECTSTVHW